MGHDGVIQTVDQREANQLQMINYSVPYQQQQPNINIAAYNPNDQNVNAPRQFDNLPLYVSPTTYIYNLPFILQAD